MATIETTNKMSGKISELTITEFRELVADTIQETIFKLRTEEDTDAGLELNPEIVTLIERQRVEYATGKHRGYSLAEILRDLGPDS